MWDKTPHTQQQWVQSERDQTHIIQPEPQITDIEFISKTLFQRRSKGMDGGFRCLPADDKAKNGDFSLAHAHVGCDVCKS